ncbi:putative 2-acylglycerol O-acyltransferase [Helianthus annuus]|nr:putative 2-acylglycerol O-acyltransferase [Helianthus annuus]
MHLTFSQNKIELVNVDPLTLIQRQPIIHPLYIPTYPLTIPTPTPPTATNHATTEPPTPPSTPTLLLGRNPRRRILHLPKHPPLHILLPDPNGQIFTQSWRPSSPTQPIKATVFMTHGYGSDSSWCFQKICIAYAQWGYAVFAADLLGHGRSDGLQGYIGDMDKAAATSLSYFVSVRKSDEFAKLPAFLFGESMGGAITMLMYLQSEKDVWSGLIFSSPLFVIPEAMVPSKLHLTMYGLLFGLADTWAAMPENRMVAKAIKDFEKLKIIAVNPKRYTGKPRVGTMREVVRVTNYLQNNFQKVTAPFFVAHGTADGLACHSGSEMLYEKAATPAEDKTLKLYEGMYHSLIQGEPDESVAIVLADMNAWLDEKAQKFGPQSNDSC